LRWSQTATAAAGAAAMSIEVVEVGDDNRNRKCNGEHAGDDAHRAYQLAPDTDRRDVTVAYRRHSDDRPPKRTGNRRQLGKRTNVKKSDNQLHYLFNKTKEFTNTVCSNQRPKSTVANRRRQWRHFSK